MENFIKFITSLIKFLIIIKMGYLFTMNYLYPEEYPLSNLTWWIYFLVFDISGNIIERYNPKEKSNNHKTPLIGIAYRYL